MYYRNAEHAPTEENILAMPSSDTALLHQWRNTNDADAFAELLARHASMVYGACLRVVRNPGVAEEVAQECFIELMEGPKNIRTVGAWLHTVATRRALDRLKAEGRRRTREANYAADRAPTVEATWDDTSDYVDEAIAALPDDLREAIVLRFLEGKRQQEIAELLSVSRTTVRSRIENGIEQVRGYLDQRGVLLSAVALTGFLESLPVEAAPSSLLAALGKRALASKLTVGLSKSLVAWKVAGVAAVLGLFVAAVYWGFQPPNAVGVSEERENRDGTANLSETPEDGHTVASVPGTLPESETLVETTGPTSVAVVTQTADEAMSIGWTLDLSPDPEVLAALDRRFEFYVEDVHLQKVLESIQRELEINIVLDSRVVAPFQGRPDPHFNYASDGRVTAMEKGFTTLKNALHQLLTPLGLVYEVRGSAVWVSTPEQLDMDHAARPPFAYFAEGAMLEKIAGPVILESSDQYFLDGFGMIGEVFDITFEPDRQVVPVNEAKGERPVAGAEPVKNAGRIGNLKLKNMSLMEALYIYTRLC